MHAIAPSVQTSSALAALMVDERDCDMAGLSIPRPEMHLVVRFGEMTQAGLDVHAMGFREKVHRKLLRRGLRTVTARLRLGAHESVLGVPASVITGRVIALEDLWGSAATRRLFDRLADTKNPTDAARVLEHAIAERLKPAPPKSLALDAARRLSSANVQTVASDLGVSERHLRRVFREAIGVSPKTYASLMRFHRALGAARESRRPPSWATVAADAGYYDQAHLIADFRTIAGVTPQALLGELRLAPALG